MAQWQNVVGIAQWAKNATADVRVAIGTYRGHRMLNIRQYVQTLDGQAVPTRKGICLPLGQIGELAAAIEAARERLQEEGHQTDAEDEPEDDAGQGQRE